MTFLIAYVPDSGQRISIYPFYGKYMGKKSRQIFFNNRDRRHNINDNFTIPISWGEITRYGMLCKVR